METSERAVNETGLYVSHLMITFPVGEERNRVVDELTRVIEKNRDTTRDADTDAVASQIFVAASFGHESDAIVMILTTQAEKLIQIEQEIKNCGVQVVDSFLSLTETSEYTTSEAEEQERVDSLGSSADEKIAMMDQWRERMTIYAKHKLFPELPPKNMEYLCFYPMSKKREGENNWFSLPFEKRAEYMRAHGTVGRKYSGRILQLITGSTGLTDWEWGVSLFSKTLSDIKDIVYEMRFDEASALYGEFGHFTIGRICEPDQIFAR